MKDLLVGQPVLVPIDMQMAEYNLDYSIPQMSGYGDRVKRAIAMVQPARNARIPVIILQERHSGTLVDFGRELDGSEGVHCLEDDPQKALVPELPPRPHEYFVPKRRYSAFFGTDFDVLLKGLKAKPSILFGALTDICVRYTFVDAHQHDYHVRVVTDAVGGSLQDADDAALRAME